MGTLSPIHWLVAAVVILLLFGPKTLSRIGNTAGRSVRSVTNFKKTMTEAPERILGDVTRPEPPPDQKS